MKKGNLKSKLRISRIVVGFITQEFALVSPEEFDQYSEGTTTDFFVYDSLGKSLIHKLNSERNGTFILKSSIDDLEVRIKIGKEHVSTTIITIKNKKLHYVQTTS